MHGARHGRTATPRLHRTLLDGRTIIMFGPFDCPEHTPVDLLIGAAPEVARTVLAGDLNKAYREQFDPRTPADQRCTITRVDVSAVRAAH